jgi:TRAP-type C4-dicarboxylate transport system permease small subunit
MTAQNAQGLVRRILDSLYNASAVLSALCLIGILIVIVMQMVARWSSVTFPGSTEYAGYLMASASFLAFASALNRGIHIRVGLALAAMGRYRWWGELWCMVIATAASSYLAWYAVKLVYWSRKLGDISQGQDATPLWLVQIPMAYGAVLLAVCFADNLITLVLRGHDNIVPEASDHAAAE